jgi:hypothetical protein
MAGSYLKLCRQGLEINCVTASPLVFLPGDSAVGFFVRDSEGRRLRLVCMQHDTRNVPVEPSEEG